MFLLAKFGGHSSYENGNINYCISSYMDTSQKAELTASICYTENSQNKKHRFTILKSRTWLEEKQKLGQELQLQSVMLFM